MQSRKSWSALVVMLLVVALWLALRPRAPTAEAVSTRPTQSAEPREPATVTVPPAAHLASARPPAAADPVADAPKLEPDAPRTALPAPGTKAQRRIWVSATYGPGEGQLGKSQPQNELYAPQGFVPTPDGKLLVLDSAKMRLVWFDKNGALERAAPLPTGSMVMPAAVAVAKDGTIVVVDHAGLNTKGLVILDAAGNKKRELPQVQDGLMSSLYIVGKDIYAGREGAMTIKLGDIDGSASDETPGIPHQENGLIPGFLAPDGQTVLTTGIDDAQTGRIFLTAMKGDPAVQVFTRFYKAGAAVSGISFVQADARGNIYMVIGNTEGEALLCTDSAGEPTGMVPLPAHTGLLHGEPFHEYSVVDSGGLVYQELSDNGSTYEWFDCH